MIHPKDYLLEPELLLQIINLVPEQIFLKDAESRFLLVNKAMSELFGVAIEDIVGKTDRDFWQQKEEVDFYSDIDRKVIETGQRFEIAEEPQTHRDGKKCINRVIKMPFMLSNGEKCLLGIAIDITDIKEAERARFEIASGVLHDIGNAVVGFGSYLTRIKRLLEHSNVEDLQNLNLFFTNQRAALEAAIGETKAKAVTDMLSGIVETQKANEGDIDKSIKEQLNIIAHIQEILNIQRQYVSGKETGERNPVNLNSIITDCVAMLSASFDKNNISVSVPITTDLPMIQGDRTKLMQVILNILKNSLEAIDEAVANKYIHIRLRMKAQLLVLEIEDNGIGFDAATAAHLFERQFTTKTSGTGLGLYNCKTIIESQGGTIDITSEGPGKGALVIVTFTI